MAETSWSRTTRYIVGVSIGVAVCGVVLFAAPLILITIIAGLIAFLVSPIVRILHEILHLPRGLSVLSVHILVAILILLSPLILVPFVNDVVDSLRTINTSLDYEVITEQLGISLPASSPDAVDSAENSEENIVEPVSVLVGPLAKELLGALPDIIGAAASLFLVFFYLISSSIYLSLDGARWRKQIPQLMPPGYQEEIDILLARLARVWTSFLRGQLIVMAIIGLLVYLGLNLLGVPGAAGLGLLAGILEMIPNLGPTLATIPAVAVAFLSGSNSLPMNNLVFALVVLAFYVVLQQVETYVITPRVMGKAVEIYPMIITAVVLLALPVAGLLGAFLAVPIVASTREIGSYLLTKVRGGPVYLDSVG